MRHAWPSPSAAGEPSASEPAFVHARAATAQSPVTHTPDDGDDDDYYYSERARACARTAPTTTGGKTKTPSRISLARARTGGEDERKNSERRGEELLDGRSVWGFGASLGVRRERIKDETTLETNREGKKIAFGNHEGNKRERHMHKRSLQVYKGKDQKKVRLVRRFCGEVIAKGERRQ